MDELDVLIKQFNELCGNDKHNEYYLEATRSRNTVRFKDSQSILMIASHTGLEFLEQIAFIDDKEFDLISKMINIAKTIDH